MNALDDAADVLRAAVDSIVARFGGPPHVRRDAAEDCDPVQAGRSVLWAYQIGVPARPESTAVLHGEVTPALVADGWVPTRAGSERVEAVSFHRDGYDLGVMIGVAIGADVVVGGSTPCLPA